MVGIEKQQEIRVFRALSVIIANFGSGTVHEHAECSHPAAVLPILVLHAFTVRPEPHDIFGRMLGVRISIIKGVPVKVGMFFSVLADAPGKVQEFRLSGTQIPVIPGRFIVLAIAIFVARLGSAELITAADYC